jgi:hypothetical protein
MHSDNVVPSSPTLGLSRPWPFTLAAALTLALAFTAAAQPAAPGGRIRVEIKDPAGKPVDDAVASLVALDSPPPLVPPAEPAVILQVGEEFKPYVTPVVAGTRIRFPNRDKIAHHVFSLSPAKRFDIPRYRGDPKDTILFDQPGIVSLGCNLHDWMAAYVVVLATPYFGLSAGDGHVTLTSLPPGRYRLEVWHPRLKEPERRELSVAAPATATQVIAVTLGIDRRIRRAPESGAGGYK